MERFAGIESDEMDKFLASLTDLKPVIPDELVRALLNKTGFRTDDVRVERYIALAAQKFLADIANDAIAHSRMRQTVAPSARKTAAGKENKVVLTIDDLERAVREYGISLRKPPYFADSVNAGAPDAVQPPVGKPPAPNQSPSKQAKP